MLLNAFTELLKAGNNTCPHSGYRPHSIRSDITHFHSSSGWYNLILTGQ